MTLTGDIKKFYDYFHKTNGFDISDKHFKEHFKEGFEGIEELSFAIQDIKEDNIFIQYFSESPLNFKRIEEIYKITIKEFGCNRNESILSAYCKGFYKFDSFNEDLLIEDIRKWIVDNIEDYDDYTVEEINDMDEDELLDNEDFEVVNTEARDEQYHDQAESLLETLENDFKILEKEVFELKKFKVNELKDICRREKIRQCIKGGGYTNKCILINNILEKRRGKEFDKSDKTKIALIMSNYKYGWTYH